MQTVDREAGDVTTGIKAWGEPMSLDLQEAGACGRVCADDTPPSPPPPQHGPSHRAPPSKGRARPRVLVVDDDEGMRETLEIALHAMDIDVVTAHDGRDALDAVRAQPFDLMIVDLAMPDINGTEVVRRMQADGIRVPFILLSAFLTTPVTVEAMRLGAADVVDKLVDIEELTAKVESLLRQGRVSPGDIAPTASGASRHDVDLGSPRAVARPASGAERWADAVVRACQAPSDPRTMREWARAIGTNESTLRDWCNDADVRARHARDLTRVLRALLRARAGRGHLLAHLVAGDPRTLRALLARAELQLDAPGPPAVEEFLERQRFVPRDHPAVDALRRRLLRTLT